MKRTLIVLALLLPLSNVSAVSVPKKATKPPLSNIYGVTAVLNSASLNKGYAYILAQGPYIQVLQNTGSGLLLKIINLPISYLATHPDTFFLQSTKPLVDDSYLPVPTCATYNGIMRYTTALGSSNTVHQFTEISCNPYITDIKRGIQKESLHKGPATTSKTASPKAMPSRNLAARLTTGENLLKSNQIPEKQSHFINLLADDYIAFSHNQKTALPGAWYALKVVLEQRVKQTVSPSLEAKVTAPYLRIISALKSGEKSPLMNFLADDYNEYKHNREVAFPLLWQTADSFPKSSISTLSELSLPTAYTEHPVDPKRWHEIYRKDQTTFYIDIPTVEKQVINVWTSKPGGPSVEYSYWMKTLDLSTNSPVPEHHSINCRDKLVDTTEISPESKEEVIYQYFCTSVDAMSTPAPLSPQAQQNLESQQRVLQIQRMIQAQKNYQNQQNFIPNYSWLLLPLLRH